MKRFKIFICGYYWKKIAVLISVIARTILFFSFQWKLCVPFSSEVRSNRNFIPCVFFERASENFCASIGKSLRWNYSSVVNSILFFVVSVNIRIVGLKMAQTVRTDDRYHKEYKRIRRVTSDYATRQFSVSIAKFIYLSLEGTKLLTITASPALMSVFIYIVIIS